MISAVMRSGEEVWMRIGVRSEWSPQYNVKIGAPVAVQPMDRFLWRRNSHHQWAALPGAASYELWVDNITTGQRNSCTIRMDSDILDSNNRLGQWARIASGFGDVMRGALRHRG